MLLLATMKSLRSLLVVAVLVLFGAALWWVARPVGVTGSEAVGGAAAGMRPGAGGRGNAGGGVQPASVDLSGAARVSGQVVDEDELPVGGGTLVLSCLHPDDTVRRIEGGVVSIGEDGSFDGPGCRYEVCAQLRHPAVVPAAPWLLRPGFEQQLQARHLARLTGQVVDPRGDPVPAAEVTFSPGGEDPDPTAVLPVVTKSTTTDADGVFSVALIERPPCDACMVAQGRCPEGPLFLHETLVASARASGWGPGRVVVDLGGIDEEPLITLQPGADPIGGTLLGPDGGSYPRAFILARSIERPREQRRAEVDGSSFEVFGLGEGPHDLRAIQDGVELATARGVLPGQSVAMQGSLPARGPDVVLRVVDASGSPVQARIDGGPFSDHRTDAQGQARATAVLPGDLRLRIRAVGRTPTMVTVSIPEPHDAGDAESGGAREPIPINVDLDAHS